MLAETVSEKLFFSTVRIETTRADGAACCGTGFFFEHRLAPRSRYFVVSNRHVVEGMREGALRFLTKNGSTPALGSGFRMVLQDWAKWWFGHPSPDVDIAICEFEPIVAGAKERYGKDLFYQFVSSEIVPTDQQLQHLDALESVIFIGYPNGVWDARNCLPLARRGTTASPLQVDFEGKPLFIIDASVFGGSSGSPVFLYDKGTFVRRDGAAMLGTRLLFLGVVAGVFFRRQQGDAIATPIPAPTQLLSVAGHEMIDLGIVIKSRAVIETVEAYVRSCTSVLSTATATTASPDPG